ncbi:MAG: hypothetical protein KF870_07380 [Leadbetterella sp.]|nr:hypothetical protein [Leadbetterella sp.]
MKRKPEPLLTECLARLIDAQLAIEKFEVQQAKLYPDDPNASPFSGDIEDILTAIRETAAALCEMRDKKR